MSFNSYIFIFAFLPITLIVYWLLRKKEKYEASICFLTLASFLFYATLSISGLFIFIISLLINYIIARKISSCKEKKQSAYFLAAGVIFDVALLSFFKYLAPDMAFAGDNISAPGISFYTFCEIAFLTECHKGSIKMPDIREYLKLMTFFPKLSQGPVLKPADMLLQGDGKKTLSLEEIYRIIMLFCLGMFKKVIIADTLGRAVDYGYTNLGVLHTGEALVVMLSYTLELYFDFSGYCDMAEAIAKSFGFTLPINFDSPYKASNIIDFWKRWHITLTNFFTEYIYIPLGGSRKGRARTYINVLIIFFISGLWHGRGAQFIIWGMMHGILYAITRAFIKRNGAKEKQKSVTGVIFTFIFVNTAWVFFRAPTVKDALWLFSDIGQLWFPRFNYGLAECFNISELWYVIKVLHIDRLSFSVYILMFVILALLLILVFFGKNAYEYAKGCKINLLNTLLMTVLFIWCVLSFEGVKTYLYVNF